VARRRDSGRSMQLMRPLMRVACSQRLTRTWIPEVRSAHAAHPARPRSRLSATLGARVLSDPHSPLSERP
jgi:hypothetical protein